MCGAPANTPGWINSGTQNNVILSNLPPNTLFYYRFGSPGKVSLQSFVRKSIEQLSPHEILDTARAGGKLGEGADYKAIAVDEPLIRLAAENGAKLSGESLYPAAKTLTARNAGHHTWCIARRP